MARFFLNFVLAVISVAAFMSYYHSYEWYKDPKMAEWIMPFKISVFFVAFLAIVFFLVTLVDPSQKRRKD